MSSPGVAGSQGERDGAEEPGRWEGEKGQTEQRDGKERLWANEGSGTNKAVQKKAGKATENI